MPPHFSSLSNLRVLFSEPFEITAQSGKRYFVHSDVLVQFGSLHGATAGGKIDLSDWDDDTVGRFIQYLYAGDYQVPEPTLEEEEAEGSSVEVEVEERERIDAGPIGEVEGCIEKDEGGCMEGRDGANTPDTVQSLAGQGGSGPRGKNVLLAHMKVYALAKHKDIEPLQSMALERLKTELESTDIHTAPPSATTDVIELLEYVYDYTHSHTGSQTHTDGRIRDLVSTFTAKNLRQLIYQKDMASLLNGGGEFVLDLMDKVAKRVCGVWFCEARGELSDARAEVEHWKNLAVASDEKVRQLETANAEKAQRLEAISEKMWKLEVTCAEEVRQMETKMQQSEAINSDRIQKLEAKNESLLQSGSVNLAKIEGLGTTKATTPQQLASDSLKIWRLEHRNRLLEADWKWLETSYPEKARERKAI